MEWMPSEIIAAEPEMPAAMNLTMPTRMFAAMAAMTDAVLPCPPPWDSAAGAALGVGTGAVDGVPATPAGLSAMVSLSLVRYDGRLQSMCVLPNPTF